MSRPKSLFVLVVTLLCGAALWYIWMLASAKLELGGNRPDKQQVGVLADTRLRAMDSYCTGVVTTAQGTWLVGREQGAARQLEPDDNVVDLETVVYGKPGEHDATSGAGDSSALASRRDTQTSFISRLDGQGQFKLVAHVNGPACLVASPDGSSVFLLTGLDRPEAAKVNDLHQSVVFRSDDQGKHWTWLPNGWFPAADWLAWSLTPYFHGKDEVWATSPPQRIPDPYSETASDLIATGVFYSADRGVTSTPIYATESLLVPPEYPQARRPEVPDWSGGLYGVEHVQTHVIQVDPERAFIWVSQTFMGSNPDGVGDQLTFSVTTRAQLQRKAGQWQVTGIQRDDNLYISALKQNDAGRVVGLVEQGDSGRTLVAELDIATLAWRPLSELPSVFGPLASDNRVRDRSFRVGQNSLLINTISEHYPPRWLYGWSDANISAEGVFYSNDWGQSWEKLAVEGYLGVLGFQPEQDRVFWAKGYGSDGGIYSYGLR